MALGRKSVIKAVEGVAPAAAHASWVDVSAENRTGFDVSILKQERSRIDGDGRMAHDIIDHAEGTVSLTLDSTAVSRTVFAAGGGRRVSFLYLPEGAATGKPYTIYQCLVGVSKEYEAQGGVVYSVSGEIEKAPVDGVNA